MLDIAIIIISDFFFGQGNFFLSGESHGIVMIDHFEGGGLSRESGLIKKLARRREGRGKRAFTVNNLIDLLLVC